MPETVLAVNRLVSETGSIRAVCRRLGLPQAWSATLSRVARGEGPVSLARENELRAMLGLPPIPVEMKPAPVCPHCGVVHTVGDCRGKLIHGGEIIIRRKPRRKAKPAGDYRPRIPRQYAGHFRRLIHEELARLRDADDGDSFSH